ncbi:LysR substrate-binding domain-containing protein [Ureibacillus sp. NPDC094379]
MNLQQLKVFVQTVQLGKLSVVAEQLNIKQPTVTFHLKSLQEKIGVPLFDDTQNKHWLLTDAGKDFYYYALKIVHLLEESEQVIDQYRNNKKGKLQLGASQITASYLLPSVLAQFQKENEEVYISLDVNKTPLIIDKVKNYELDLGIIAFGNLYDRELIVERLIEDELVLVMHPEHPLGNQEIIAPEDLTNYPFMLLEKNSVSHLLADKWMYANKIELNVKMEIGSIETIKAAVEIDSGLAILPKITVEKEQNEGRLMIRPLPNYENEKHIYLIYRNDQHMSPMLQTFINYFKEMFKPVVGVN